MGKRIRREVITHAPEDGLRAVDFIAHVLRYATTTKGMRGKSSARNGILWQKEKL
jgi:hypothetical protein